MATLPSLDILERAAVIIAGVDPHHIRHLNLRNSFVQAGAEVSQERFNDWIESLTVPEFVHVMLLDDEPDDDPDDPKENVIE